MSALNYIESGELAALLREKSAASSEAGESAPIVIMDVRGEDEFSDGHIVGATHAPSTNWSDSAFVQQLVEQYTTTDGTKKKIVFHCAMSQQRGPTCARLFLEQLAASATVESGHLEV